MKITAFLLLVFLCNVHATGNAQSITLSGKNMPLKSVFSAIRQQTGYYVFYEADALANSRQVSFAVNNMPLKSFLDIVFKEQPFGYSITSKTISIIAKSLPAKRDEQTANNADAGNSILFAGLSGTITDFEGQPLSNVSVRVRGGQLGTMTNTKGYFSLQGIPDNAVLVITCISYRPITIAVRPSSNGYTAMALDKNQLEDVKASTGSTVQVSIRLRASINELEKAEITFKKTPGVAVELKNRRHQTLVQLLEGSVPGLTLKSDVKTSMDMNYNGAALKDMYDRFIRQGINLAAQGYPNYESYLKFYYDQANSAYTPGYSTIPLQRINYITKVENNGIVPELRGASGFGAGTSGMLVVIDGFPQDNFPADYPLNNVESVRIIRDPAECVKWGPKAAGGIIMITTAGAEPGKLNINYTSNLYFSPIQDNSNRIMHLASTADILDYYKEGYDKGLSNFLLAANQNMMTPAQRLLYDLNKKKLTPEAFQQKWDSMSVLSNRDQLKLLQQDVFTHNHTLGISGGGKIYQFNVSGTYRNANSTTKGSKAEDVILNLKNDVRLLKGKLRTTLDMNTNFAKQRSPGAANTGTMDSYQLLLDQQGKYVYNNYEVAPALNSTMTSLGYLDYGINPLEDLLNSQNLAKSSSINSRLNVVWDLAKQLQWSASVQYNPSWSSNDSWQGINNSNTRKVINDYALSRTTASGNSMEFYVPPGDIMRRSSANATLWNARSGFTYRKQLGTRHVINISAGVSAASTTNNNQPDTTLYGYNRATGTGLPIIYTGTAGFTNYLGRGVYPMELLIRSLPAKTMARNTAGNANLTYTYHNKYEVNGSYNTVFMPVTNGPARYAQIADYNLAATWMLHKEKFFQVPWISMMRLTTSYEKMQLPWLTPGITSSRTLQPLWSNANIFISDYIPAQFNGQTNDNVGAQLQTSLSGDRLMLTVRYNESSLSGSQFSGTLTWDVTRERFFHKGAVSSLQFDLSVSDINPYQGLALMMSTNAPREGGGFSQVSVSDFELLPAHQQNKEAHARVGILKDRFVLDGFYYRNIRTGMTNGEVPTDPATGLLVQTNYSKMLNQGFEMQLMTKLITNKRFQWTMTVNGAYNINKALNAPKINYTADRSFLSSIHDGYAMDNLWSYSWAGLDASGNPQIYNGKHEKVNTPDSSALVYSGRTRAPWTGAIIQNLEYRNFFFNARAIFNLGHVFRSYMPASSGLIDNNELIAKRWKKPGDEATTDVPVMAAASTTRNLIIQNSSNTIERADNIRLREIQLGYSFPAVALKGSRIKGLTLSVQVQNVALWTRNKFDLDPQAISDYGLVTMRQPAQYMFTVNMNL
ncbi:SusC/RagA family TonB-linked outer membrane protein [Chitinophaga sp. sic0106]|uniref:SusC/RagA family TonB-linked outer membrane protein n=1 Tax=Chitinophaga sp. sic0106 TaxID=2854785 RepID=UPI001C439BB7|nr:SusC/RagA family TonB-linked outer membrane protein [Chitinophaga sp. sic0106]MBV7533028.1 carboxypeptidase-like regulatory domain-containing protein [Chitinophaga sp. sic0106]